MKIKDVGLIAGLGLFMVVAVLLGYQIYLYGGRLGEAQAKLHDVQRKYDEAQMQNERLQADMHFYSNPANLEKELRGQFNYKQAGEGMMIIVPTASSTATST